MNTLNERVVDYIDNFVDLLDNEFIRNESLRNIKYYKHKHGFIEFLLNDKVVLSIKFELENIKLSNDITFNYLFDTNTYIYNKTKTEYIDEIRLLRLILYILESYESSPT